VPIVFIVSRQELITPHAKQCFLVLAVFSRSDMDFNFGGKF